MNKICPKCKKRQDKPEHLGCDICHVPFVTEKELIKSFTQEELKVIASFLLKDWRVYVVASIGLLIGISLLYWQAHEQIRTQIEKFQAAASNQVVVAYSKTTNQLTVKFQEFTQNASNQIASAYSLVTNKITDQFQEPRVKETVEAVAKGEAKIILEREIQPVSEKFQKEVQEKLFAVKSGNDFLELATKARAHDYQAYLQLHILSRQTNEIGKFSLRLESEIDRALMDNRAGNTYMTLIETDGKTSYRGPFSSDEIASKMVSWQDNRTAFEAVINAARNFHQPMFLMNIFQALTNETDLMAADRETLAISELTKQDFHPKDLESIEAWWKTNRVYYTNWPYSDFQEAVSHYNATHYADAANAFEKVLQLDGDADMSRALAAGCYWDVGETNKAISLAKQFKEPSGRWAKWASAKAELESGNTSNATVQVAFISTNFPMISFKPHLQTDSHFWRKIDWALFNELTKTP